jgi:hypothetical protein
MLGRCEPNAAGGAAAAVACVTLTATVNMPESQEGKIGLDGTCGEGGAYARHGNHCAFARYPR